MTDNESWAICYAKLTGVCEAFNTVMGPAASARPISTDEANARVTVAADYDEPRPSAGEHVQRAWNSLPQGFLSSGFITDEPNVEPPRTSWTMTMAAMLERDA